MDFQTLNSELWDRQQQSLNSDRQFLKNIGISCESLNHAVDEFIINSRISPGLAIGYAKLFVMELWAVREFLKHLKKDVAELDRLVPKLMCWRDSYAHLKERVKGLEEKPRNKPVPLKAETRSLAGGKLVSSDGCNWTFNGSSIFNFEIAGNTGAISIFGLVDDYLICNTVGDPLEIQINRALREKLFICIRRLI
jgi:hypothetical protein